MGIASLGQFFRIAPRRLRSWAVEGVKADFNDFGKTSRKVVGNYSIPEISF